MADRVHCHILKPTNGFHDISVKQGAKNAEGDLIETGDDVREYILAKVPSLQGVYTMYECPSPTPTTVGLTPLTSLTTILIGSMVGKHYVLMKDTPQPPTALAGKYFPHHNLPRVSPHGDFTSSPLSRSETLTVRSLVFRL